MIIFDAQGGHADHTLCIYIQFIHIGEALLIGFIILTDGYIFFYYNSLLKHRLVVKRKIEPDPLAGVSSKYTASTHQPQTRRLRFLTTYDVNWQEICLNAQNAGDRVIHSNAGFIPLPRQAYHEKK